MGGVVPGVFQGVPSVVSSLFHIFNGILVDTVNPALGIFRFILQTPQRLFCGDDLPLQSVVLVLGNLAPLKLLLHLLFSLFQGVQLFFGGINGII